MSVPAVQTYQLRCHHCSQWVGESSIALEFAGMFKHPRDCSLVEEPRSTYRCKGCGWITVFRPLMGNGGHSWRAVELKRGD